MSDLNYGRFKARRVLRYLIRDYRFFAQHAGYIWRDEGHADAAYLIARMWSWEHVL